MNIKRWPLLIFIIVFSFSLARNIGAETNAETPKESEIIGYLQQGLVVFLCFHKDTEPNIFAIKSDLNSVANNFKGAVNVIYVGSDEKAEEKLRENFQISPDITTAFIIVPPGRAVAKLEGTDITKTNLMKALYSSCGGGGCSPSGCK